ncbi:hypothetical protein CDQ92_15125 [Sphingopyxis bauzanensis]|uniref:Sacsin/Nov domain-containing protein n=1 Tax=Sphingopyxis bauzanensis TaxID=651663 RepID=A0A246JSW1_9SPHN|nr:hypothetical protein [Sphingopyxis bauzanensis]OWQ96058.1 hypothetical protein CDQ92_15125 [Sphingopyxis bauzanensis]GGJ52687.1 hypothetical protein GCM10011393_23660 [Sphingopyxis bauzanensis]
MSVINDVRAEREDLARVLEKHSGIRKIVEDLYPDSAHFIYELLQNAEDRDATEVKFILTPDKLIFEHNGEPFRPQDIYAITDIGEGTKAHDDDKIGRFGVGFKAVFAYSETPHIWSPTFSFKICRLVLPFELEHAPGLRDQTRFEFPFDNPKKTSADAHQEIKTGLSELAETTLLFLPNIESIKWELKDELSGEILRVAHTDSHIEVMKQVDGRTTTSAHYLKFSQPVAGLEKQRVAIAFALDLLPNFQNFTHEKPLSAQLKIVSVPGQVAVFFPAGKETSGLRFHLHAPFVPELSRASIKETPANKPLFEQLAILTASSLHTIRDLGLLSNDFLGVLPNPQDSLGAGYVPIRAAICEAMNDEPLTPTHAKGHAPARTLVQAKSALKDLLSHDDIEFLIDYDDDPPQWAASRALQGTNVEKFMNGLAITDWDIDEFVSCIEENTTEGSWRGVNADFMQWLASKNGEWHQQFYALLAKEADTQSAIWRLKRCRIVRLAEGRYGVGPKCHFPSDSGLKSSAVLWVDDAVYTAGKGKTQQESARKFLEDLGVTSVGEWQFVEAILKDGYTSDSRTLNQREYATHLRRFMKLLDEEPASASLLASHHLFLGKDDRWHQPASIFLDAPYLETGISEYINILGTSNKIFALADAYASMPIDTLKVTRFAEKLGSLTRINITTQQCSNNPKWDYLRDVPGERYTATGINRDYGIRHFKQLTERKSVKLSKLVWDTMRLLPETDYGYDWATHKNPLRATYRMNESNGARFADSVLVHQLRNHAWVPQGEAEFVKPAQARSELLPEGFTFDAGWPWLKAIQFGRNIEAQSAAAEAQAAAVADREKSQNEAAKALGFNDAETARKAAEIPADELNRYHAEWVHRKNFQLPKNEPKNPERRALKVSAQAADAPGKVSEHRTRSVSVGIGAVKQEAEQYLRQQYTNPDGEMICQICSKPLPFRLPDGRHYVEKVEFFDDAEKRHFQNYLALCPNHAAMFQYALGSGDVIHETFLACDDGNLEIILAGSDATIYFTGTHMADLKAIMES